MHCLQDKDVVGEDQISGYFSIGIYGKTRSCPKVRGQILRRRYGPMCEQSFSVLYTWINELEGAYSILLECSYPTLVRWA